jgi:hypothetical protein
MDVDVTRVLDEFAGEVARLTPGSAPAILVERTQTALHEALIVGAGCADAPAWGRLYRAAGRLIAALDGRDDPALPGLRAFLAENADLRGDAAELAFA